MTVIFALVFITAILISTSLLVVLLGHQRQYRKTEAMQEVFNSLSAEFGLAISTQDVFADRIIGLDEINRNLLFVTKDGSGHITDLDDVKSAAIKKEWGLVIDGYTRKKGANTAVKRIELEMIDRIRPTPVVLSLYDSENSNKLKREKAVEMAEKWQTLVSGILIQVTGTAKKSQQRPSSRKNVAAV